MTLPRHPTTCNITALLGAQPEPQPGLESRSFATGRVREYSVILIGKADPRTNTHLKITFYICFTEFFPTLKPKVILTA